MLAVDSDKPACEQRQPCGLQRALQAGTQLPSMLCPTAVPPFQQEPPGSEQTNKVCTVSSPLLRLVALEGLTNHILLAIHQLILNL